MSPIEAKPLCENDFLQLNGINKQDKIVPNAVITGTVEVSVLHGQEQSVSAVVVGVEDGGWVLDSSRPQLPQRVHTGEVFEFKGVRYEGCLTGGKKKIISSVSPQSV